MCVTLHASYPWFMSWAVSSSQTRTWNALPSRHQWNISSIFSNQIDWLDWLNCNKKWLTELSFQIDAQLSSILPQMVVWPWWWFDFWSKNVFNEWNWINWLSKKKDNRHVANRFDNLNLWLNKRFLAFLRWHSGWIGWRCFGEKEIDEKEVEFWLRLGQMYGDQRGRKHKQITAVCRIQSKVKKKKWRKKSPGCCKVFVESGLGTIFLFWPSIQGAFRFP